MLLASFIKRRQSDRSPFLSPLFFTLIAAFLSLPENAHAARIISVSGSVRVQSRGGLRIENVSGTPFPVAAGDRVLTAPGAKAVVSFSGGSKLEVGGGSDFLIETAAGRETSAFLKLGRVRAWVKKMTSGRFSVRTPTAVSSVRGTEFQVESFQGGRTVVSLFTGLLDVTDRRGEVHQLTPGQRIETDFMGVVGGAKGAKLRPTAPPSSSLQENARREVGLDMDKDAVLAAAARELKLAEYEQGKALIDVNGARVRIEQYILRPAADQFKLVVLNEREDRFDYFFYRGTFNTTLPDDLSAALRMLNGTLDATPAFYLTGFETGRSNTKDSIQELAAGGHPVDVNANGDLGDDVSTFFDAAQDKYVDSTGRSVFQTIFDNYGFYVNGALKYGWTGSNLQSYSAKTWSTTTDPITGAALAATLPIRGGVVSEFPDAGKIHQKIYESYTDGTSITWDNYIIDDEGQVASDSDFSGIKTGASFTQRLLDFNYQQIITATEFQGRKIDLVIAPKILLQAGLIQ